MFVKMATTVLTRLESNAIKTEEILASLRKQVFSLQELVITKQKQKLATENMALAANIQVLLKRLTNLEERKGIKQYYHVGKLPSSSDLSSVAVTTSNTEENQQTSSHQLTKETRIPTENKGGVIGDVVKKQQKEKKTKTPSQPSAAAEIVDVRRLDFRIGRIIDVQKHPDADTLYVEKVDIAESEPRTVVSGLVRHVPMEEMQNKIVVLLCNLKPAKMRGITSQAMVMCASSPDKIEILNPPEGSQPGDLVEFDGFPRTPDAMLNPKKKIFETCAPLLQTDDSKVATYDGVPFTVAGKGVVVAPTLTKVFVK